MPSARQRVNGSADVRLVDEALENHISSLKAYPLGSTEKGPEIDPQF